MKKEIKFFNRLLKKMFGYKNYREGFEEVKRLERYFLNVKKISACDLTMQDMNCSDERLYFAKYKTLKKILDAYLNCVEAVNFNYEEYKENYHER